MANDKARLRLEVPIFGPDDGLLAVSMGASRLELNRAGSYALGGTTPTLAELAALLSSLGTSSRQHRPRPTIRIMIRPRGPPQTTITTTTNTTTITTATITADHASTDLTITGLQQQGDGQQRLQDFLYTPAEFAAMAASVREFATSGLLSARHGDGFVFGVLHHANGQDRNQDQNEDPAVVKESSQRRLELDVERNRELVRLVSGSGEYKAGEVTDGAGSGLACVLHRAVDDLLSCSEGDVGGVMERLNECRFDGVLTSGGRGNAVGNVDGLREVVESVTRTGSGMGTEVIVGGGVRKGNLGALVKGLRKDGSNELGERVWFHSSCLGADGKFDTEEARGLAEELRRLGVILSD
ncbi:copper homeostasis CutC domain-containing protein [Corynascus novoguineensis]|uniref:Copper homeostasis protein cutC homolog n=1 Tax=Corynascus novoguineensis TaxID=1126955 RepID=A0AAN7CZR2_9PEZI|nr:copper homeostasis CutC domain-containing protein [Corynascus novoguineensis]